MQLCSKLPARVSSSACDDCQTFLTALVHFKEKVKEKEENFTLDAIADKIKKRKEDSFTLDTSGSTSIVFLPNENKTFLAL